MIIHKGGKGESLGSKLVDVSVVNHGAERVMLTCFLLRYGLSQWSLLTHVVSMLLQFCSKSLEICLQLGYTTHQHLGNFREVQFP